MRLRYTGSIPVTFTTVVGEVEPDAEFDVPDEDAPMYISRPDIEQVEDDPAADAQDAAPPKRNKSAKAVAAEPTTDTTTTAE